MKTQKNPACADVATKGTTAKALYTHDLWWHGLDWLSRPSSERKTNGIIIEVDTDIGDISTSVSAMD